MHTRVKIQNIWKQTASYSTLLSCVPVRDVKEKEAIKEKLKLYGKMVSWLSSRKKRKTEGENKERTNQDIMFSGNGCRICNFSINFSHSPYSNYVPKINEKSLKNTMLL